MGEWMIHPCPPIAPGEWPSELLLTNGNLNVVYKPERTCKQKRLFNLMSRECDGEYYEWHGEEKPNYCPNCGAKVVDA